MILRCQGMAVMRLSTCADNKKTNRRSQAQWLGLAVDNLKLLIKVPRSSRCSNEIRSDENVDTYIVFAVYCVLGFLADLRECHHRHHTGQPIHGER